VDALRLSELRDLLQSPAFAAWWSEFARVAAASREAAARREDLVDQAGHMELRAELAARGAAAALARAGASEDRASAMNAQSQVLENEALELVAAYEELRFRVSDLWYRLGGAERILEERRENAGAAGPAPAPARQKGRGKSRAVQARSPIQQAERMHASLKEEYEAEARRKDQIWAEVEVTWGRSFEISLVVAEGRADAERVRREAGRSFKEAEQRRDRARRLREDATRAAGESAEAERRQAEMLERARERFGCVPGRQFLYWRRRDDPRSAYAVPLVDDADGYNIELRALGAYVVDRQRGVAFLEPAREGLVTTVEEGDRRFEAYFLGARKGGAAGSPPSP
jgi:hypothetical protein